MPRFISFSAFLAAALCSTVVHAAPDNSDMLSPHGDTILGHPLNQGPTAAMECESEPDGWFFDVDNEYTYLTYQVCEAPADSTDLDAQPTGVLLYFHNGQLIGGDASLNPEDTRNTRLQLRQWFGIPIMDDGQFQEDELYAFKDVRYTFSYGAEEEGLFVIEHLDRLRAIIAGQAPDNWDAELKKALAACTTALVDDAPGVLSWPDRPHPWTYPLINWPENDGDPASIYLTSFGAQYEDQFGFEQALPEFGCTYQTNDGSVSLTTS